MAGDVVRLQSARTVDGRSLRIAAESGRVTVNDARVIRTDIACSNGVIHVIDTVILPGN